MKKGNKSNHPKKRFCLNGHDTFVCGRTKDRACKECKNLNRRIDPLKDSRIKQFCPSGHNTFIVGRDKSGVCKKCKKEWGQNNSLKKKEYYEKKREYFLEKMKEYRKTHSKEIKEKKKKYREKHNAKIKKQLRKYRQEHKKELNAKALKRKQEDIQFKIACNLRDRINCAIRRGYKVGSAVRDLGCSIEFFKTYIEDKFYGKMTWENWGTYWELDHIIPLWKFDLTDRKQFLEAVNYKNMQPLTIPDHKKKSAKESTQRSRIK